MRDERLYAETTVSDQHAAMFILERKHIKKWDVQGVGTVETTLRGSNPQSPKRGAQIVLRRSLARMQALALALFVRSLRRNVKRPLNIAAWMG